MPVCYSMYYNSLLVMMNAEMHCNHSRFCAWFWELVFFHQVYIQRKLQWLRLWLCWWH